MSTECLPEKAVDCGTSCGGTIPGVCGRFVQSEDARVNGAGRVRGYGSVQELGWVRKHVFEELVRVEYACSTSLLSDHLVHRIISADTYQHVRQGGSARAARVGPLTAHYRCSRARS
jgi:hypothetical protein